jgi:hypothetical protein
VENKLFNKVMNYTTEQWHKNGKFREIKKSLKDFYLTLRHYYNDDEVFEKFLTQHHSLDTLKKLLNLIYGEF